MELLFQDRFPAPTLQREIPLKNNIKINWLAIIISQANPAPQPGAKHQKSSPD